MTYYEYSVAREFLAAGAQRARRDHAKPQHQDHIHTCRVLVHMRAPPGGSNYGFTLYTQEQGRSELDARVQTTRVSRASRIGARATEMAG